MTGRFYVCRTLQGIFACAFEIDDGAPHFERAREVHSEFRRNLTHTRAESGFPSFSNLFMQPHAPPRRNPLIENILIQGMKKPITASHRTVRPFFNALFVNKLSPASEFLTVFFYVLHRGMESRRHRRRREFHADDARDFEQALLLFAQSLNLSLNELTESIRHSFLNRSYFLLPDKPPPFLFHHYVLPDEIIDHVHNKKRISSGPAVNCSQQVRWESCCGKTSRQAFFNRFFRQRR
jgi:hypothetical protein